MADTMTTHSMQDASSSSTLEFRRRVYAEELWVEGPPQSHPLSVRLLLPWLQREMEALLPHQADQLRLMSAILWELAGRDLCLPEFTETVRRYLGPRTSHFVHEFLQFTGSSLSMESYDRTARYGSPDSPSHVSSDEDECQVVGMVRPRSERTPEIVDLTNDDAGAAVLDNADDDYPIHCAVPPTSSGRNSLTHSQTSSGKSWASPDRRSSTHSQTSSCESGASPEYRSPIHSQTSCESGASLEYCSPSLLTSSKSWASSENHYHYPTYYSILPGESQFFCENYLPSPPYSRESWTTFLHRSPNIISYSSPSPIYCPPSPTLTSPSNSQWRVFPVSPNYVPTSPSISSSPSRQVSEGGNPSVHVSNAKKVKKLKLTRVPGTTSFICSVVSKKKKHKKKKH